MMKILRLNILVMIGMVISFTVLAQEPVVTGFSPQDNAAGVSVDSDLQITFGAAVQKGMGTVVIRQVNTDAVVEAIDVNSGQVVIENATVTIDPSVALPAATELYVQINAGAFESLSGIAFAGFSNNTTWNFTTGCGSAPMNVTGIATSNIAILEWDPVPGVSDYQVWVSNGLGVFYTNGNNYFDLENLPAGTTYDWSVRSVCYVSGQRVLGPTVFNRFTTRGTNPCTSSPVNLSTDFDEETSEIVLSWDYNTNVLDYQVWVNNGVGVQTVSGSNSLRLDGLPAGTTYTWGVKSRCINAGKSVYSEMAVAEFTTPGSISCASAPEGLTVDFDEETGVTVLSWDFDVNVLDYQIWVNNGVGVNTVDGANILILEGLPSGTTYSWGVKSRCINNGRSVYSNMTVSEFTTPGESPCATAPVNLTVDFDEQTNETILSWDSEDDVLDYQVWVNNGVGVYFTNGSSSYRFENLLPETTYTWGVKTRCVSAGRSVYSNMTVSEFTTPDFIEGEEMVATSNASFYNSHEKLAKEGEYVSAKILSASIYPNPTVDIVNLVLSSDELISALVIRNGEGIILEKLDGINLNSQAISLGKYGTGIYIINIVTTSGEVLTKKVIVN